MKLVKPGRYLLGVRIYGSAGSTYVPYPRTYYPGVNDESRATVITIAEGQTLNEVDLQLPPRLIEQKLEGIVSWPDSQPIMGATVWLKETEYPNHDMPYRVTTDEKGLFSFKVYEGMKYTLNAIFDSETKGKQRRSETLEVRPSGNPGIVRLTIPRWTAHDYLKTPAQNRNRGGNRDMQSNVKNLLLIALIWLAVVLGCSQADDRKLKEFKEAQRKLNAAATELAKLPAKEQLTSEPYLKGKVVMVRQYQGRAFHTREFDVGQFGEAAAKTPEEVQTVVVVSCLRTERGFYRTNENPPRDLPAFSHDCDLTLIDRTIPAVIFKKRFEAKIREEAGATANTKEVEAYSEHEITDFLKSLPRK